MPVDAYHRGMGESCGADLEDEAVRKGLDALRADAMSTARAVGAKLASLRDERASTVTDDEHDPEGSTLTDEWALAKTQVDSAEASIAQIDAALARLDAGCYGVCLSCGRPITPARLAARPTAENCIDCARREQRRAR